MREMVGLRFLPGTIELLVDGLEVALFRYVPLRLLLLPPAPLAKTQFDIASPTLRPRRTVLSAISRKASFAPTTPKLGMEFTILALKFTGKDTILSGIKLLADGTASSPLGPRLRMIVPRKAPGIGLCNVKNEWFTAFSSKIRFLRSLHNMSRRRSSMALSTGWGGMTIGASDSKKLRRE